MRTQAQQVETCRQPETDDVGGRLRDQHLAWARANSLTPAARLTTGPMHLPSASAGSPVAMPMRRCKRSPSARSSRWRSTAGTPRVDGVREHRRDRSTSVRLGTADASTAMRLDTPVDREVEARRTTRPRRSARAATAVHVRSRRRAAPSPRRSASSPATRAKTLDERPRRGRPTSGSIARPARTPASSRARRRDRSPSTPARLRWGPTGQEGVHRGREAVDIARPAWGSRLLRPRVPGTRVCRRPGARSVRRREDEPRSTRTTRPSRSRIRLAGFTSPWTTP